MQVESDGGATGHWRQQEHSFFLALWTQLAGVNTAPPADGSAAFARLSRQMRDRAVSSIPSRSGAEARL